MIQIRVTGENVGFTQFRCPLAGFEMKLIAFPMNKKVLLQQGTVAGFFSVILQDLPVSIHQPQGQTDKFIERA